MQMPEISRRRALAYIGALLALLVVAGHFVRGGSATGTDTPARSAGALKAAPAPPRVVVVDVVGAVRRPGLYRLRDGSRTADAIARAGGATPKAALELINLAAPVADGQQVLVPRKGSPQAAGAVGGSAGTTDGASAGAAGAAGLKVHLNSATLEQLDSLPGVGPVTAQKILDYRTQHGAFGSVDELDAVPGIGPARLEQLKPLVDL
jgi:competence protein ComEA